MPLLIKGNYKGTFGEMSQPQWLTPTELVSKKFTTNKGIFILTNSSGDIGNKNKWNAIDVKWLDKLLLKANSMGDKKMWILRTSIYILLSDPNIYNSNILNKKILSLNTTSTVKFVDIFDKYQSSGNPNTLLVSRQYVKNEINVAETQYYNI